LERIVIASAEITKLSWLPLVQAGVRWSTKENPSRERKPFAKNLNFVKRKDADDLSFFLALLLARVFPIEYCKMGRWQ